MIESIVYLPSGQRNVKKFKADFAKLTSNRDNFKLELAAVTQARDKLQTYVTQYVNLKVQLCKLTKE